MLEIAGALEGAVVLSVFDKLTPPHIEQMKRLNNEMLSAIHREDFDIYYRLNIKFHDVFLNLSENAMLKKTVMPLKQRLYDFPRRTYIKEWELINCQEHSQFVEHIEKGERNQAASLMQDSHWSFKAYEKFIRQFYFGSDERIESELAWRK